MSEDTDIGGNIAHLGLGNVITALLENDVLRGMIAQLIAEGRTGAPFSLKETTDLAAISTALTSTATEATEDPVIEATEEATGEVHYATAAE